MNYDRLYDMTHLQRLAYYGVTPCICAACNNMRGTGIEPASPKAPDPKSGTPAGSITRTEGEGVTERHTAPSSASPTTTESTTCAESRRLSLGAGQ